MKKKYFIGMLLCAAFCAAVDLWIVRSVSARLLAASLCVAVDILVLFCFCKRGSFLKLPKTLFRSRGILWSLACNDFRSRFAGSLFGSVWAFVQPTVTMVLYWFVFAVGLRSGRSVSEYPFILYLMCGLIPWFYFQEAWNGGTNSMLEYSYLVKKVVFQIDILPAMKIISAIFVNLFFIGFVVVFCCLYGYYPSVYALQIFYYLACNCLLLVGMTYLTSACALFFRDVSQVVTVALSIGVWVTPIMWNPAATMSPTMQTVLKINPVYYIVDGFRDALLTKVWFWDKPLWTIWFWVFTIALYCLGVSAFYKLKQHFADML